MTPMYNRVPKVTADFWIIKLLAVTMGETAADYLAVNLGLGLTATSLVMSAVLAVALAVQFAQKRYVPWAYWLAVVLISVVGTLVTDNLVDTFGVRLITTTWVFALALAVTFAVWFASERTLSIHAIFTTRREAFYWLAILFTFALGTAAAPSFGAGAFALGALGTLGARGSFFFLAAFFRLAAGRFAKWDLPTDRVVSESRTSAADSFSTSRSRFPSIRLASLPSRQRIRTQPSVQPMNSTASGTVRYSTPSML